MFLSLALLPGRTLCQRWEPDNWLITARMLDLVADADREEPLRRLTRKLTKNVPLRELRELRAPVSRPTGPAFPLSPGVLSNAPGPAPGARPCVVHVRTALDHTSRCPLKKLSVRR